MKINLAPAECTIMQCFWANVLLLFWMCGAGAQLKEKWQE